MCWFTEPLKKSKPERYWLTVNFSFFLGGEGALGSVCDGGQIIPAFLGVSFSITIFSKDKQSHCTFILIFIYCLGFCHLHLHIPLHVSCWQCPTTYLLKACIFEGSKHTLNPPWSWDMNIYSVHPFYLLLCASEELGGMGWFLHKISKCPGLVAKGVPQSSSAHCVGFVQCL